MKARDNYPAYLLDQNVVIDAATVYEYMETIDFDTFSSNVHLLDYYRVEKEWGHKQLYNRLHNDCNTIFCYINLGKIDVYGIRRNLKHHLFYKKSGDEYKNKLKAYPGYGGKNAQV